MHANKNKKAITLTLSNSMMNNIEKLSTLLKLSKATIIRRAVEKYLDEVNICKKENY